MTERVMPEDLDVWRELLRSGRLVWEINMDMEAEDALPLAWFDVLHTLQEEGGGRMRLSALANAVLLSRSGLTRLLNQLEENDLIRRVDCEEDRRGLFAELTPGGRRAVERSWPAYNQALFNRISRRLGPGEARTLADLLGKLNVDERAR